ncbi:PREDICTED: ryanodine receptor-like [Priapulus caudatus]|uniref:Ryanodine receptor-like n=1 Tax=Priapulus caudatus TaxID=37621 RepID=A0ABM1DXK4_PRICU|nr:PREDICTED: ryanodine receptor-like [Priapulus caudatus]
MADPQEKDGGDSAELDDIAFLRTGDTICISCNVVMASRESMAGTERVCLAAEGFGNRTCFLENISDKNNPPDLTMCGFVIEQALSVRALQEMIAKSTPEEGTQSGHRTLLYGHAVLLRHNHSNMFLSCLSTQTTASSDKLAFDVGLKEDSQGESCWWTIHPASKQRSEGEKVRVGDDVILVSVATERYLHTTKTQNRAVVIASFHQTLWSVSTVCSGSIRAKTLGSVFGADVLRFFKNVDECLTVPPADSETKSVLYESGEVMNQARSLWRLELIRTKWSSAFVGWANLCRIRHITTGRYLCVNQDNLLNLVSRDNADVETTAFCLRQFKDDKKVSLDEKEEEGMGSAQVKYSDSMAFIQHVHTGLWLSYETHQTKKKGVGRVEEKIAVMLEEGHMDDGFTVVMAQEEESRSARVIRKCSSIFNRLVRALNSLQTDGAESALWHRINLNEVVMCLGDLILYFEQPPEGTEHEEKQQKLKALRNRQDLFQEEGMIALVLEVIDEFSMYQSPSYFAAVAGEEAGQMWEDISSSLYLLLAAMIKGNHSNCAQFADSVRLDWLFNRLESQQASEDICATQVLNVLCSLCVGNGMAVRSSQNHICDNLLPSKDLLLQTSLVDHVSSMRPNIFVCVMEGSAMYKKWYFEAVIDYIESSTHLMPHLRIGWANTEGYKPYPGGGENWGGNGVGDDLYSYGFDGGRVWAGGKSNSVQYYPSSQGFSKGDVIGCFLDFTVPEIAFSLNGVKVNGVFRNFNTTGLFFPCISLSAKVSARFMFGNEHGKFRYGPHDDFSPIIESMLPREQLRIEPCMNFGDIPRNMIGGPIQLPAHIAFIPTTVDTSKVVLPNYIDTTIDGIREKLAENIHELWSVSKIEAGYTWGEVNDEQRKKNVCLTTFEKLPETEKNYNIALAQETLKTFFALGYHIRFDKPPGRLKTLKLPNHFLMANGYKPTPLDMRDIPLNEKMEKLVDLLADNTHNVWARDHIQMQWTYGLSEDHTMKRSPHLVPYDKVDDSIKKKNRDTASETVRTLMAYGYGLDSPPDVADSGMSSQNIEEITSAVITYRGQKTYAVMSGKWYYEFEVLTTGFMKLGWVSADHAPNKTIGNDEFSYGFDGFFPNKWHQGRDPYGKKWTVGDVIGVFLDLHDSTVSFSLNGELMMDSSGSETAFSNIEIPEAGFVPAFSIGAGQLCKLNMGQDVNTLKFFTQCGLQEGYEPFCVNMTNNIIMWYNKELGLFQTINELDTMIEITRIPPGSDTPPIMHVAHKTYGSLEGKSKMEFLRLSVPVQCQPIFTNVGMTSPDSEPGDISIAVPTIRPSDVHVVPTVAESTKHGKKGKTDDLVMVAPSVPAHSSTLLHTDHVCAFTQTRYGGHSKGGATAKPVHGQQKSSKPFKFLKSLSVTKGDSGGKTPPAQPSKKMNLLMPSDMAAPAMPSISVTGTEGETMLEQIENSRGGGGGIPMQRHSSLRSNQNRQPSGAMSTQSADSIDMEMEYDPNAHVDTDVYFYAVRIFPGQDPVHVNVGWVQPYYHYCSKSFTSDMVRQVMFTQPETAEKQGCLRQNCYMVNAKAMQMEAQASGRKVSQGLVIGCYVDTTSGMLTFSVNGTKVDTKYQVGVDMLIVGPVGTLPLSAALNKGPVKDPMPQCPSRLAVQRLTPLTWGRVPQHSLKVHTLKLSEIRGWSMLCEDPVSMLAVQIPEEDRCIDVLELIEQEDLLMFHACTLKLYCAICFRGNHRAAHILCGHVDKRQFMYLSQSKYLAGPLRKGFLDLLIALHLTAHVDARLLTQKEYILPLTGDIKSVKLSDETNTFLPSVATTTSIRPQMKSSPVTEDTKKGCSIKGLSAPEFELDCLKQQVMSSLADGVQKSVAHCRDPIGGSYENLFVPLLKLADCLLVIGLLDDDDIYHLMVLIDPVTCNTEGDGMKKGLLHVTPLDEGIQLQLCNIFHHLCDINLRHRVESIIAFCDNWVDKVQIDQLKRYIEIKKADLQPAVAAKKTREFRCPPKEQMRAMLTFRTPEDLAEEMPSPCNDNLKEMMLNFNKELLALASVKQEEEEEEEEPDLTWQEKLIQVMLKKKEEPPTIDSRINQEIPYDGQQGTLNQLIARTVMKWGSENFIEDQSLIREMFSLLHRQYDGVGELCRALEKTYTISVVSKEDFEQILVNLSQIRALLEVQLSVEEEVVLRSALWDLMNNKIFFQHPDLMRALCVHENVMRVMVNTLNKSQVQSQSQEGQDGMGGDSVQQQDCSEMVTSCCRFLCYFCRSSAANQRASFEHLSYFLDNSTMLVARPSLRGSAPLDVAYSSLMDNNELALALRETHLEKVAVYLSRCGLQSNAELLDKGYPDIGWDPVEGERYLDFMRFCVWVNGECVEENANLVIRLLIRRPECLGPALRGEGGGLLKAMKDGIRISQEIAVDNAQSATAPEDDEDYIDMGGAILTFYAALVDLLGRCAPDAATIHQAKSDSIRARAILRSLVSMEDLEGCLSLHFMLPNVIQPDKADDAKVSTGLPPGLLPCHRQAVLLFMERVYGIPDQETFFRLLEDGLLPDLRTAVLLDTPEANDSDLALALNRYLCQSVLPLLTNYAHYFHDSEHYTELLDATLQTSYRISKCATLTKVQREVLSDFLVAFTRELRPVQMLPLLRKLIHDVPSLNEYTHVSLNILNLHYERCGQYYGSASGYGTASEDEKRLTMMLFSCIFDSLANRAYDPNLFAKALPCLSAIGCALSPDYTLTTSVDDEWFTKQHLASMYTYTPTPVDTSRVQLPPAISDFVNRFAEQYHDAWASRKLERGWTHADSYVPEKRLHPRLKPFDLLTDYDRRMYREPIEASLRAMLANGWSIASGGGAAAREAGAAGTAAAATGRRRSSMQAAKSMGFDAVHGYSPKPVDMTNLSLTKEMQALAERLAENAHDIWARKTIDDLRSKGGGSHPNLIPYDMMTDREKRKERLRSLDMVKFLQLQGYKLAMDARLRTQQTVDATDESGIESRFAHSLLTKLLGYLDRAGNNLNKLYTSRLYSRRNSYVTATEDVKFFGKVALPLVERYFVAHRVYFLASGGAASMSHASIQEKELVGSLFCKLASLLRSKFTAFGSLAQVTVKSLEVLVQAIDAGSVVKSRPDFVRALMQPFFNNAADDLTAVMDNMLDGTFLNIKETARKSYCTLNYAHMVLLPVLTALFNHLGVNNFGKDLLVEEIQLACYKILNSLYTLGVSAAQFRERRTIIAELDKHRSALGQCLGAFASTFPVAFLEPDLNKNNQYSLVGRSEEHSLEAQVTSLHAHGHITSASCHAA